MFQQFKRTCSECTLFMGGRGGLPQCHIAPDAVHLEQSPRCHRQAEIFGKGLAAMKAVSRVLSSAQTSAWLECHQNTCWFGQAPMLCWFSYRVAASLNCLEARIWLMGARGFVWFRMNVACLTSNLEAGISITDVVGVFEVGLSSVRTSNVSVNEFPHISRLLICMV